MMILVIAIVTRIQPYLHCETGLVRGEPPLFNSGGEQVAENS